MKKIIILLYILTFPLVSFASSLDKAKEYFKADEFEKALPLFKENYKKNPRNASINQWLGVCLFYTGEYDEAQKYLKYANKKKIMKSSYYLALIEYKKGNYQEADEYVDEYEERVAKGKNELPESHKKNIARIRSAVSMLDHVEKILIIDSLTVDRDDFFKTYRISPEVGSFTDNAEFEDVVQNSINPIYVPESGEKLVWSAKNEETGHYSIYQSTKLIDNSWDSPHVLDKIFTGDCDYICPFIKPDGTSIYFASNSDNSIGGYDIFVAGKDLETNDYFIPQNMGLPYNSPYNDFLLVYDEINKFGWWATDRNQIEGKITIYVFVPNEVRVNYPFEDEKIESLAFVRNIKDTWTQGEDYADLRLKIQEIDTTKKTNKNDFLFVVSNEKTYTSFDDFITSEGLNLMENLISLKKQLADSNVQLSELRVQYQNMDSMADSELKNSILELEKQVKELRNSISKISNDIRKLENNNI